MARKFGMIGSTVWDSEKFVGLSNDSARLTYLYLCTTQHGNGLGVFKLPSAYLAVDRHKEPGEADAELQELEKAGLIELGVEGQIRITQWFKGPSGANSPSTGSSYAKNFMDPQQVKPGRLKMRAAIEMMHATLDRSRGWNPETKQLAQMQEDFVRLLKTCVRDHPQETVDACEFHGLRPDDVIWNTMWDTMYHTMSHTIPPTVRTYIHGHLTPETDTGHLTPDTGQREGDRTRAKDRALPSSPPTSTPAKGSRSGGGKVPEDVARTLASIGRCDTCQTKVGYGDCPACKKNKSGAR